MDSLTKKVYLQKVRLAPKNLLLLAPIVLRTGTVRLWAGLSTSIIVTTAPGAIADAISI
jgi:hypothetical protein